MQQGGPTEVVLRVRAGLMAALLAGLLPVLLAVLVLAACGVAVSGSQPGNQTGNQNGAGVPGVPVDSSTGADPGSPSPGCPRDSGSPSLDCSPSTSVGVAVSGSRRVTSVTTRPPSRAGAAGERGRASAAAATTARACGFVVRAGDPAPTGCPPTGPTTAPRSLPVTLPVTMPPTRSTYPGGCSPVFYGTPPGPVSSGWTCPVPTYRDCSVNGMLTSCPPPPLTVLPSTKGYPTPS